MNMPTTPSLARGIRLTPRLPDFRFAADEVPDAWFAGDVGRSAVWGALSVLAGSAELGFIDAGRWLVERIDDPALADETRRFVQQEAFHGAVHARFNRVLADKGLPTDAVGALMRELIGAIEVEGGRPAFLAAMLAAEQVIGEMGHAVLDRPEVFDGVPEAVSALWMWHCYEEVEHTAALHDAWRRVFGESADERNLRLLGAAYILVLLATAWPAASWRMVPASQAAARWRPAVWASPIRQLFGADGLMRGAARNLRGLVRVSFHPFDHHDPVPTLERERAARVRPEWARPVRDVEVGDVRPAPQVGPVRLADLRALARFTGFAAGRALAFARAA